MSMNPPGDSVHKSEGSDSATGNSASRDRQAQLELLAEVVSKLPVSFFMIDDKMKMRLNYGGVADKLPEGVAFSVGTDMATDPRINDFGRAKIKSVMDGTPYWAEREYGNILLQIYNSPYSGELARGIAGMCIEVPQGEGKNIKSSEVLTRFRRLIEVSPEIMAILTPSGHVEAISNKVIEYFGSDYLKDLGSDWRMWGDFGHPDDVRSAAPLFAAASKRSEPVSIEGRLRRHDGQFRRHTIRIYPLKNEINEVVQWVCIALDVEDQRRREFGLRLLTRITDLTSNPRVDEQMFESVARELVAEYSDMVGLAIFKKGKLVQDLIVTRDPGRLEAYQKLRKLSLSPTSPRSPYAVYLSGKSQIYRMITEEPWIYENYPQEVMDVIRATGFRTGVAVPIKGRNETVGVLSMARTTDNSFDDEDLALIEVVGDKIAKALENAWFYQKEQRYREQLILLTARLQTTREEEQKRISRDIHDQIGQQLTVVKMELFQLSKSIKGGNKTGDEIQSRIVSLMETVDRSIGEVRGIAAEIRPIVLEDLGLVAGLEWLVDGFQKRTGILCRFKTEMDEKSVSPTISDVVFRICQEALTNALRHSQTKVIEVRLLTDFQCLKLVVNDFGKGLSSEVLENSHSLGIVGMRERAKAVSGYVEISNREPFNGEPGVRVVLTVPLDQSGAQSL